MGFQSLNLPDTEDLIEPVSRIKRHFKTGKTQRGSWKCPIFALLLLLFVCDLHLCQGFTYTDVTALFEDKLGNGSGYNTAVRPTYDQTQVTNVNVSFDLIAIVEINDIFQKFIVNGFLGLTWTDEIVAWDLASYNYNYLIHPEPRQIWRPRLILMNTLEDRDLFEDDYSPTFVLYTGLTTWYPGSLFPTSCKLYMRKYPFDTQSCPIQMFAMGWVTTELNFIIQNETVGLDNYVENGEWQIINTAITSGSWGGLPFFEVTFNLKRRSGFFILNIVMPIVLLSFLNILVFMIPVDSGEKISYGITVLLALTVFMSIVSDMLPQSSDVVPLVTIYLLVLLIISVCTVIVAIMIVWLHHREEQETKRQNARSSFINIFRKVRLLNRATKPAKPNDVIEVKEKSNTDILREPALLTAARNFKNSSRPVTPAPGGSGTTDSTKDKRLVNRYKMIGKHVDMISFIVFMVIWISTTAGFISEITS